MPCSLAPTQKIQHLENLCSLDLIIVQSKERSYRYLFVHYLQTICYLESSLSIMDPSFIVVIVREVKVWEKKIE